LADEIYARTFFGRQIKRVIEYTVQSIPKSIDLQTAIFQAIKKNSAEYLNPPISNLGYKGILKTSKEILKWLKTSEDPPAAFSHTAMMMEKAGTGGALFRAMYRDFLAEAYSELQIETLDESRAQFDKIAKAWVEVSNLFIKYSETEDHTQIKEASDHLAWLSEAEKSAVEFLSKTVVSTRA